MASDEWELSWATLKAARVISGVNIDSGHQISPTSCKRRRSTEWRGAGFSFPRKNVLEIEVAWVWGVLDVRDRVLCDNKPLIGALKKEFWLEKVLLELFSAIEKERNKFSFEKKSSLCMSVPQLT